MPSPSKLGSAWRFLGGSLKVRCYWSGETTPTKQQSFASPTAAANHTLMRVSAFLEDTLLPKVTASYLQTRHERHKRTFRDLAAAAECANHQAAAGIGVWCQNRVGLPT